MPDDTRKTKTSLLINQKAVRSLVRDHGLRTSREFMETLDNIVKAKILKAVQRNKSLKRTTLKKDELFM